MNEDGQGNELPITDADTTPPNPAAGASSPARSGWQMPEPKFQKSSGYLPQGYVDEVALENFAAAAAESSSGTPPPESVAEPEPLVEPQPDLSEQLEIPAVPAAKAVPAKQRSTGARIAMIILGLLGMVVFISVFLGLVYYLFLMPRGGNGQF